MEPNDLPIVCLPLELSGDDAAALIDFLYQLIEVLERHYSARRSVVLTLTPESGTELHSRRASTPHTQSASRPQNRALLRPR